MAYLLLGTKANASLASLQADATHANLFNDIFVTRSVFLGTFRIIDHPSERVRHQIVIIIDNLFDGLGALIGDLLHGLAAVDNVAI